MQPFATFFKRVQMFYIPQDWVKVAIDRLGGSTRAANTLAVSGTTIQNWIRLKRISNIDKAKQLAKLTGLEVQKLRPTL